MKRWLISIAALAALLAIVAPGLIGRAIGERLRSAGDVATDGMDIRTLAVDSGWFRSVVRHRVTVYDEDIATIARLLQPTLPPAGPLDVIVETRIAHGPLPFAAFGNATLWPAIVSASASLTTPQAPSDPLPGRLTGRIGLTGRMALDYRLPIHDRPNGAGYGSVNASAGLRIDRIRAEEGGQALAAAISGDAQLTLPAAMATPGSPYRELLLPLIAGGYLQRDGEDYRLRARLRRGALTVNGAPLPFYSVD